MAESENGSSYKCEYLDVEEGEETTFNWLPRPGKAHVTYPDGCTYEGSFNEGRLKHGHGIYKWTQPSDAEGDDEEPIVVATYDGSYENGKRNGIGKLSFPNGDKYTGEWKDNLQSGRGTTVYKNGDIYSGEWLSGKRHGHGTYQFAVDDSMYRGNWTDDKFVEGQWILSDGTVYSGTFSGGRPIGDGSFSFPNGIVQRGTYVKKVAKAAEIEGEEEKESKSKGATVTWVGEKVVKC